MKFNLLPVGFTDRATYTLTKYNTAKLVHKGYSYIKASGKPGRWQCLKQRRHKCRGKAETRYFDDREMVRMTCTHNHLPNDEEQF